VFPAVDAILLLVPHENHVYIRNCSTSLRSGFGAFASQMAVWGELADDPAVGRIISRLRDQLAGVGTRACELP
jgi:hypothetical protein